MHLRLNAPRLNRPNRPALCGCASSGKDVGCYGDSRFTDYSSPCLCRFCCLANMSLEPVLCPRISRQDQGLQSWRRLPAEEAGVLCPAALAEALGEPWAALPGTCSG